LVGGGLAYSKLVEEFLLFLEVWGMLGGEIRKMGIGSFKYGSVRERKGCIGAIDLL
jgi:hypothetical protein